MIFYGSMLILNNLPFSRVDWLAWNAETKEVGARGLQSKSDLYNLQPILANYFIRHFWSKSDPCNCTLAEIAIFVLFIFYLQSKSGHCCRTEVFSLWMLHCQVLTPSMMSDCYTFSFRPFFYSIQSLRRLNVQYPKTMSILICEHNVKDDNLIPRTVFPLKGGFQILFDFFVMPKYGKIWGPPPPLLQKIHHIDLQKVSPTWGKNGAFKAASWGVSPLLN